MGGGRNILFLLILAAPPYFSTGQDNGLETTMLPGSVKNFELPSFDETNGTKQWELFGEKALYVADDQIDVDNLKLDIYEGGSPPSLRAVVASPRASANPKTKIVVSNSSISAKGGAFKLDGRKWSWNGDKKFVEIFSDVTVELRSRTFNGSRESESVSGEFGTRISSGYASLDHGGKNNVFKLAKNVKVDSKDMSLACDTLEIDAGKDSRGKDIAETIRAAGNIRMLHDDKDTRAGSALIIPERGVAVLSDSPSITDIPTRASLSADAIRIDRPAAKIYAERKQPSGKRPEVDLVHADSNGKSQNIKISADSIEMASKGEESEFVFKDNIEVSAEDFKASADILRASAKRDKNGKSKIETVKGEGNIVLTNETGTARAGEMQFIPDNAEIWLGGNATLVNDGAGTRLECPVLILMRSQNRGIALSDAKEAESFVKVSISEAPKISGVDFDKGKNPAVILSRRLNFSRDGNGLRFQFLRDVSIKSADNDAHCQKMDISAQSKGNGSAAIKKITASEGVVIKQKDYEAKSEYAVIYPRLEADQSRSSGPEKPHRFVELSTPVENPGMRPIIILPPVGNLGFEDASYARKPGQKATEIKSDKQWLASSADADRYFFEGNVDASGTDMKADCDRVEVVMRSKKRGAPREISQIIMTGNVKLNQGLKDVSCGRADIYVDDEIAVLNDNPVVVNREDNSRASGSRIVYNKGNKSILVESQGGSPDQNYASPDGEETGEYGGTPRPTITIDGIRSKTGKAGQTPPPSGTQPRP